MVLINNAREESDMQDFGLREPNPDWERIRKTVMHEEPDRVPILEALVEYPIISRFLGREITPDDLESQVEFYYKAGYDAVPITVSMMAFGKVTEESPISKVIQEKMLKDEADRQDAAKWSLEQTSFIDDREDFEAFPWEALEQTDLSALTKVQEYLPDGMKVIANSGKVFTLAWMLMGFNNFATKLVMDEELVSDIFTKIATIQLKLLDRIFEVPNVGAVWLVDDMAFGTGPIISPDHFRQHVFPWYRKIVDKCHQNDILVFLHSDGDVTKLIPDMIEFGIDLFHPVDPTCMSVKKVKEEFGDRLAFAGNVANELLRSGTPEEIDGRVKYLMKTIAPGGGYCLSAGNSVPDWAQFENYIAMLKAAEKYGSYPIQS
jgi:uroporphyrinogen decarboxylase